jgi:hypothetical protein
VEEKMQQHVGALVALFLGVLVVPCGISAGPGRQQSLAEEDENWPTSDWFQYS